MSYIGSSWLADPSNSNVLRQSYVTGFLDVRGNAIIRTDASLSGNIGIGGAVSISNNIGMSGVINQLISIPLQGGYIYQQVNSADALTAIAQVATLNTLVVTGNAVASPPLAPYSNPISGNVVTLGTASVNARLGGISNYVMGNLAVLSDVSLNTRLFLGGDASFGGKLSVSSDASFGGRISVGGDISVNGLSLGLGSQSVRTNTVFGNTALQKIQSSGAAGWINNTAIGYQSLLAATTPLNNTAVGSMSLAANTTGANNTAVGYGAGAFVSTGGNITCLGYNTGFSSGATQYNQSTALGYNATITGSNQVVLGTAAESVIVAGNVSIGKTTTPGFALDVVGNTQFANDVSINGNLAVNGGLSVKQMQSQTIINMTTTNYQLIVSEDISLNGKLFVSGDVSMGGNLAASSGSAANTYMNVYGKAPPSSVYLSSFSPNTTNATSNSWFNNGVTWTVAASSTNGSRTPYGSFDTSNANQGWGSLNPTYRSTSPFSYSPGAYTAYSTYVNNVGTVSGEWLQISSSVPVVMNSFKITNSNTGDVPSSYSICGSNDNNSWYPIMDVSYTSWAYTAQASSGNNYDLNGLTFAIQSGTITAGTISSTGTVVTAKYNSYGNSANSYSYFRFIFKNLLGTGFSSGYPVDGYLWFQELTPTFSIATQTGPSRTLLYMDPSNINQLDVSGSLGLINTNASTMTVTPNTTGAAVGGWQNNNITWLARASSTYNLGTSPFCAFNSITAPSTWFASTILYTVATGLYNGSVPTTTVTGIGSGVSGEWLELTSSVPVVLNSYFMVTAGGTTCSRCPASFTIAGSNDGVTWNAIQNVNTTSLPSYFSTSSTSVQITARFNVSNNPTTPQNNATITGYSTSSNAYTYFRIFTQLTFGTRFSISSVQSDGFLAFGIVPFFTPATSSVSMALDNAVPNQLNVGGSMNVAGALNVGGMPYGNAIYFSCYNNPNGNTTYSNGANLLSTPLSSVYSNVYPYNNSNYGWQYSNSTWIVPITGMYSITISTRWPDGNGGSVANISMGFSGGTVLGTAPGQWRIFSNNQSSTNFTQLVRITAGTSIWAILFVVTQGTIATLENYMSAHLVGLA
jgi:hypothetical protein